MPWPWLPDTSAWVQPPACCRAAMQELQQPAGKAALHLTLELPTFQHPVLYSEAVVNAQVSSPGSPATELCSCAVRSSAACALPATLQNLKVKHEQGAQESRGATVRGRLEVGQHLLIVTLQHHGTPADCGYPADAAGSSAQEPLPSCLSAYGVEP